MLSFCNMAYRKTKVRRGDEERNALAEQNLGLAGHIVGHNFQSALQQNRITFGDAFQEGCVGLLHAAATADESKPFPPFAASCIKGAILDAIRVGGIIRLPKWTYSKKPPRKTPFDKHTAESQALAKKARTMKAMPEEVPLDEDCEFGDPYLFVGLHEAISELPIRDRWLLRFYYWRGRSMKELGQMVHISKSGIDFRLKRIAKILRDVLLEAA